MDVRVFVSFMVYYHLRMDMLLRLSIHFVIWERLVLSLSCFDVVFIRILEPPLFVLIDYE